MTYIPIQIDGNGILIETLIIGIRITGMQTIRKTVIGTGMIQISIRIITKITTICIITFITSNNTFLLLNSFLDMH